ncbi:MAG TPA: DEAD/DEAH box helicase, partial [Ignavibacteriaceae bacterium]|nr:DEAD/DEAH box helicase [Ignavibacteriaceae bacterium]
MDIFNVHKNIIDDYSSYISSFLDISDPGIRDKVNEYFEAQKLWPQELIQFNPSFEIAGDISDFTSNGLLNKNLQYVFNGYKLYQHQVEALQLGVQNKHFIVTSGTGSGKSLAYIGTILNHLFNLKEKKKGIKALVVYPMNALINSQTLEFEKYKKSFEDKTKTTFPITFKQYTGQESQTEKQEVIDTLPDILLTNYMMLELIMTRLNEVTLRESIAENLSFLVFDELHTYRGRQGADVSMLIRRIHSITKNNLVCIGTSATMSSGDSIEEQKNEVAEVGKKIFGVEIEPNQIINETLISSLSNSSEIEISKLREELNNNYDINAPKEDILKSSLAQWLEKNIAIEEKEGQIVRRKPTNIQSISKTLSDATGIAENICTDKIRTLLKWANTINKDQGKSDTSVLPFKIHQFISQTGSVYVTLDSIDDRLITLDPSAYIIDKDKNKKPLFPVVFSRNSGYEFICVRKNQQESRLEPREFAQRIADEEEDDLNSGYLLVEKEESVWNSEDITNLPDSWLKVKSNGEVVVVTKYENKLPKRIYFDEYGNYSEIQGKLPNKGWFITSPLLFDPTSGTFFDRKTS